MAMILCYLVTALTCVGVAVSLWLQREGHEIIAQAFLGFSIALFLRRRHEIKRAAKQHESGH